MPSLPREQRRVSETRGKPWIEDKASRFVSGLTLEEKKSVQEMCQILMRKTSEYKFELS